MKSDDTFYILNKISTGMNNFIIEEINKHGARGLVTSHGSILLCLFDGTKSMLSIAERINKTPQTVTTLVKKLEIFGYVITEKSKEDRRSTLVTLTDKGKDLKPLMISASENLFIKQYKGLTEDEIAELRRLLKLMLKNFSNIRD